MGRETDRRAPLKRGGPPSAASDAANRAALELAFRQADYWISPVPGEAKFTAPTAEAGWLLTRIDQPCAALSRRLAELGCSSAQLLTACNPRGLAASAADNRRAIQRLALCLRAAQAQWLPSLAMDRAGGWREPGVLLLGEPERVRRWAEQFEQAAWVEYDAAGCGRLRWTAANTGE